MPDNNPTIHPMGLLGNAMAALNIDDNIDDNTSDNTDYNTRNNTDNPTTNPASITQKPPHWRLAVDPHLQERRNAKAAASDLRCVQQFLEDYRMSCFGRCEPDTRFQVMLMPSYFRACEKFNAIAHPGERATRAYNSALLEMHWTLGQLMHEYLRAQVAREAAMVARVGVCAISPHLPSIRIRPVG